MHLAVVVLHVEALRIQEALLHPLGAEELDQRLVLRQTLVAPEEQQVALVDLLRVVARDLFLCLVEEPGTECPLSIDNRLHILAELLKHLVPLRLHRTGDDQRCTGIIDQHGVHLVDDGVVVDPLHHILRTACHIVTQVVETELVIGTKGDVAVVRPLALHRVGLMLVDAVDGEAMELVQRSHPLLITLGEVVIDRHHMDAITGKGIEEDRQRRHQSLTLTGRHLGDLTLMEDDTADQLHVVVDHIPLCEVATGLPLILVDRLVPVDGDEVVLYREIPVILRRRYDDLAILCETPCGGLHDGKGLGEDLIELILQLILHLLLQHIDLLPQRLALAQLSAVDLSLQLCDLALLLGDMVAEILSHTSGVSPQLIMAQLIDRLVGRLDLIDDGVYLLEVVLRLVAEDTGK